MMEYQPPAALLTAVILMIFCSTAEMAGVRLVKNDDHCSGTPEVLYKGEWRRVDGTYFGYTSAAVLCRELDCGSVVNVTFRSDLQHQNNTVIIICDGKESAVSQCVQSKNQDYFNRTTLVVCSDSVRLVDGSGFCSGRLEVKTHQSWTTVCETDFDWQDAEVVCREMVCGSPLTLQGALFGEEKRPFGTKEFQCKGTEKHLLTCETSAREEHTCTSDSAVRLTCSGPVYVRLVGGISRCDGKVMFHGGEWRSVEAERWSIKESAVVCRQLNCGSAVTPTVRVSERNETGSTFWIYCTGFESELRMCLLRHGTSVRLVAGVICSGLLVQPNISFSTPIRVSWGLQGPVVIRGHSFTITCSTQPQHPGGSFYLKLPWTNRSHTQTAVNHSASFFFPAADDSHQGNYSCVYENQVTFQAEMFTVWNNESINWSPGPFLHNFSSDSESLSLTVADSPLPAGFTRMLLVLFLMLIICLLIFLICKKFGHFFIRNSSGQQGSAAAVQYENIELVTLQSSAEEQQNVERRSGEEQEEEEEQSRT